MGTENPYYPTYGAALAAHAATQPQEIALRYGERTTDYASYDRHATQVANGFAALGLSKGDRIAYFGKNSDHAVELMLGAARAGVVFIPIIWRLAPAEVDFIMQDSGAAVLFLEDEFDRVGFAGRVISMEREFAGWRDAQSASPVTTEVGPQDALLQLYTSGTTGLPKGVVLSHHNGTHMRPLMREHGIYWYSADPGDRMILAMPFGHIAGSGTALGAALGGQELLIHREFDPALLIGDVQAHQVKWLFLVPAAIRLLLAHPAMENADFSSVRGLTYGASPIPLDLLKQGVARLQCDFAQLYGMTETFGTVVSLAPDDHRPENTAGREQVMKSAGKALPGTELAILGPDLQPLAPGMIGEVAIRGDSVMLGYWNRPEENAKVMIAGGWLRTGDAGLLDEEGYLYIQDRIKDMIISGGENIYPAEVESAIFGHPAIADIAVIGIPDETWGEAVKAVVVRSPGAALTEAEVIAHARERIAGFKCPKSVDFVEALPRNPSGKILRRELRAPYWEGHERQVG